MRKALIVGIDWYEHVPCLTGCVKDAHSVQQVLERHADGTLNFSQPRLMTSVGPENRVEKADLKAAVRELFADDAEIALFYFAGHGALDETGGFVCGTDAKKGDDGLALADVMTIAGRSPAKNKVIILDSCQAGVTAQQSENPGFSVLKQGTTILTSCTDKQFAKEIPGGGGGIFTNLLIDALSGAAANLVGDITPGSVYAHIDQSLGNWAQRPVFKTNVKSFVSLRKAAPPIALTDLQALDKHFPRPDYEFPLDPSYEPERTPEQLRDPTIPPPDPLKTGVFALLQRYVKVNLVRPVGAPHMWHAAMQSKACELTVLGQHYRNLVAKRLI